MHPHIVKMSISKNVTDMQVNQFADTNVDASVIWSLMESKCYAEAGGR